MENGEIDFGLLVGESDKAEYDYLTLPAADRWRLVNALGSSCRAQKTASPGTVFLPCRFLYPASLLRKMSLRGSLETI